MKRTLISIIFVFLIFTGFLSAQQKKNLNLTFTKECLFFSGGVSLNVIGALLLDNLEPPDRENLDYTHIPWFDRFTINCDNHFTARVSNFTLITCMGLPAVSALQADSRSKTRQGLLLYLESFLITSGVTNIVKALVHRPRPFAYRKSNEVLSSQAARSFFSGHTSLAFNGAVAAGMLFQQYQPQSSWNTSVWIAGLGLASATGIFRITSGNHFLSDIIVGALVGSLTSYIILELYH